MTVAELIRELEKMPSDSTIVMFDGPSYYTPCRVYTNIKGNTVID